MLAELQNTTNPQQIGGSTPGYGSVNARARQSPGGEIPLSRSDSYTKTVSTKLNQLIKRKIF